MADSLLRSVKVVVGVLKDYDPLSPTSLEEFLSQYISKKHLKFSDQEFAIALKLSLGCYEQRKILQGVISPFCNQTKSALLKRDLNLFKVISYLLLFFYKKYTSSILQNVLLRLYTFSVRKFLLFITGLNNSTGYQPMHSDVRANWYASFDREFIDENVYGMFCENEIELRNIVVNVEASSNKNPATRPAISRITVARPFALKTSERHFSLETKLHGMTQTDEKKIDPRFSKPVFKTHRIPVTTYSPSEGTLQHLKQSAEHKARIASFRRRIDQREVLKARLKFLHDHPPPKDGFNHYSLAAHLQQSSLPSSKKELKIQPKITVKPVCAIKPPSKPVKQTTAALLREKALFAKQKKAAELTAKQLASGGLDIADYEKRIRKYEKEELETAIMETERKVIDAMLTLEKAIAARKTHEENIRQKALSEKELQKEFREQRQVEIEVEIQELRAAVEATQAISRAQLNEAKRRVLEEKQRKAQIVKEENNEIYHRYLDQYEEEMVKKKELIAQIHDMEAHLATYEKSIDFGEMPKYGFLSDMSLADLKDRLISLRFEMIEKNENKRRKITDEKEIMKHTLAEAKEFVENARSQWQQRKRQEAEKARRMKQLLENAGNYPGIKTVREQLLKESQLRRKGRVSERELRLNIKDPLWDEYEFA